MPTALDALFDDPTLRLLPVRDRVPVTAELEAALDRLIAVLRCDLVVEIGAFEADFSRRTKARHPAATVIAYEANPRVHARFAPALAGTGVDYRAAAVSDRDGTITFNIVEVVAGKDMPHENRMGSIRDLAVNDSRAVQVEVRSARLDGEVSGVPGRRACLWIDVEGAVAEVLAGAAETLSRSAIVYCELEDNTIWQGQALTPRIVALLEGAGFVLVARDCQKWFQKNALFLRADLAADDRVRRVLAGYETRAAAAFRRAVAAWRAAAPIPPGAQT